MKPRPAVFPYALLALVWLAFAAYVWLSAGRLPARVATHFGMDGVANGWQSQRHYLELTLLAGAALPAFILSLFLLIRVGDGSLMNIPHREYWLAPERRRETFAFVQRRSVWLAGLIIAFFAALHYLVAGANTQSPPNLPASVAFWSGGIFVAMTLVWVATFIRHFYRKPA
jgi:serine/threonine-protein kinase